MLKPTIRLGWLIVLFVGLSACTSSQRPVVVIEGAAETEAAATAFYATETATAGVTAQPTSTVVPYVRPTDDPAVSPDRVIASVAGHDITVAEFRNRVRFERWFALETLRQIAEISGVEAIDIRDPNNTMTPTVIGYLYTLSDAEGFAENVLTRMLQERIMHREFVDRELPPSPGLLNNLWLRLLNVEQGPNGGGTLPDNFDALKADFMQRLSAFSDLGEADLRFMLTVRSEQQTVLEAVGSETEVDIQAFDLHHILLATEAEALEVKRLLAEGADFGTLAAERSLDEGARGNGGDLGFFGTGEMLPAFEAAAFGAEIGALVGPVETDYGFHIVQVTDEHMAVHVERLVTATEAEAENAITRLRDGAALEDLIAELSVAPESDGDMGFVTEEDFPEVIGEAVYGAESGDVVGPFAAADGYVVLVVAGRQRDQVRARHILVATEAEARDVLTRLEAGEDFAALAAAVSTDPSAKGDGGDLGLVTRSQLPDALADAALRAGLNEVFGPVQTEHGYHIGMVTERTVNMLTPEQYDEAKAMHFQNWLRAEVRAVTIDDVWREIAPADPQPGDVAPYLQEFEAAMNEALNALATPTAAATE